MKLGNFARITPDDFPGLSQEQLRAFEVLNKHIEKLTEVLQSRASFAHNLNAEVRDVELTHDVAVNVQLQRLSGAPVGAAVIHSPDLSDFPRLATFAVLDEKLVTVRVRWDTAPSTPKTVRLVFYGE